MLYFVILLFFLCGSHDVYFLYAFSTVYVFNFFSIILAVVLYIDEMKCLESVGMCAFISVSFIVINVVNNLMLKTIATHTILFFS